MKIFMLLVVFLVSSVQSVYARPKDMTLRTVKEGTEALDVGAPGPSLGDISVNRGKIYDAKNNQLIGSYLVRRMILSSDPVTGEDTREDFVEFVLPKGKVFVHGVSSINSKLNVPTVSNEAPIVGGTGRYLGVKGRSQVIPVDAANGLFNNTLEFK